MDYPKYRPRRVRRNERLRELVRETRLTPKNLIYPILHRDSCLRATPDSGSRIIDSAVDESA